MDFTVTGSPRINLTSLPCGRRLGLPGKFIVLSLKGYQPHDILYVYLSPCKSSFLLTAGIQALVFRFHIDQ